LNLKQLALVIHLLADPTEAVRGHLPFGNMEWRPTAAAPRTLQTKGSRRLTAPSAQDDRIDITDINAQSAAAALSCLNVVARAAFVLFKTDRAMRAKSDAGIATTACGRIDRRHERQKTIGRARRQQLAGSDEFPRLAGEQAS
jgi:hypothetical protein